MLFALSLVFLLLSHQKEVDELIDSATVLPDVNK